MLKFSKPRSPNKDKEENNKDKEPLALGNKPFEKVNSADIGNDSKYADFFEEQRRKEKQFSHSTTKPVEYKLPEMQTGDDTARKLEGDGTKTQAGLGFGSLTKPFRRFSASHKSGNDQSVAAVHGEIDNTGQTADRSLKPTNLFTGFTERRKSKSKQESSADRRRSSLPTSHVAIEDKPPTNTGVVIPSHPQGGFTGNTGIKNEIQTEKQNFSHAVEMHNNNNKTKSDSGSMWNSTSKNATARESGDNSNEDSHMGNPNVQLSGTVFDRTSAKGRDILKKDEPKTYSSNNQNFSGINRKPSAVEENYSTAKGYSEYNDSNEIPLSTITGTVGNDSTSKTQFEKNVISTPSKTGIQKTHVNPTPPLSPKEIQQADHLDHEGRTFTGIGLGTKKESLGSGNNYSDNPHIIKKTNNSNGSGVNNGKSLDPKTADTDNSSSGKEVHNGVSTMTAGLGLNKHVNSYTGTNNNSNRGQKQFGVQSGHTDSGHNKTPKTEDLVEELPQGGALFGTLADQDKNTSHSKSTQSGGSMGQNHHSGTSHPQNKGMSNTSTSMQSGKLGPEQMNITEPKDMNSRKFVERESHNNDLEQSLDPRSKEINPLKNLNISEPKTDDAKQYVQRENSAAKPQRQNNFPVGMMNVEEPQEVYSEKRNTGMTTSGLPNLDRSELQTSQSFTSRNSIKSKNLDDLDPIKDNDQDQRHGTRQGSGLGHGHDHGAGRGYNNFNDDEKLSPVTSNDQAGHNHLKYRNSLVDPDVPTYQAVPKSHGEHVIHGSPMDYKYSEGKSSSTPRSEQRKSQSKASTGKKKLKETLRS